VPFRALFAGVHVFSCPRCLSLPTLFNLHCTAVLTTIHLSSLLCSQALDKLLLCSQALDKLLLCSQALDKLLLCWISCCCAGQDGAGQDVAVLDKLRARTVVLRWSVCL
jgi:hypothetical protein